ncbi:MAG: DUF4342 domain-containing protein [Clostridium sp.]|uniref:DUF4342 domain-containing protein n=1 Tax=Clostridium paraputrificum TaxID=29363 RepID=A0A6N3GTC5_9CLOT|nr:DUF4342 domain-containing protein [Clostridium sp.]MBS5925621.1 DUF4342 domain-containing protein [Clostridium sp.]MBS5986818.1 DUF4342 domain-containing protein [Clostridium sp.]
MEISLEKVDQVKERTGSTYKEAKEALEICGGDVLEAIIYIEGQNENSNMKNPEDNAYQENNSETIEDFKVWLKETVKKGNVSRIKVKKDETILVDVPVNAGIAATVIAVIIPPILAFGVIAAVATKLTIEITKVDGSVEVVNKYVAKAANEVKGKASVFADQIKTKIKEVKEEASNNASYKENVYKDDETVYSYTVNFDEEKEEK